MEKYTAKYLALLERKALLFDAIENAARDLPDGYEIRLEIQSGYGGLVVEDPDGEEHQVDPMDRDLAEQINDIVAGLLKDEHEDATSEP